MVTGARQKAGGHIRSGHIKIYIEHKSIGLREKFSLD